MHFWKQKICLYDISLDSIALPFHAVLFRTLSTKQFLGHLKKLWPKIFIWYHSSEIKNVHSTKCSSKIIQNWLYLTYNKTHDVVCLFFISQNACRNRPGHSLNFFYTQNKAKILVFCWNILLSVLVIVVFQSNYIWYHTTLIVTDHLLMWSHFRRCYVWTLLHTQWWVGWSATCHF